MTANIPVKFLFEVSKNKLWLVAVRARKKKAHGCLLLKKVTFNKD